MKFKGNVFKYGDNVNTDVIFPGKYTYTVTERKEMAKHSLEDLDPEFVKKVKVGDIIVAGKNFGCGSSREQAVICLKEVGISVIIAKTFARIYFRNCINEGLPALVCSEIYENVESGDEIEVDLKSGKIITKNGIFSFPPFSEKVQEILSAGGLVPYVQNKIKK